MDPCSIENSWIICMNRGSGSRQTKPESGLFICSGRCTILSPIRAPIAIFLILFSGFLEVVSTAIENTVLIGYFSKITRLIAIRACNLKGFCWSLFLAHSLLGFFRERLPDTLLLPAIAIRSENLGFAGECVHIFFQKIVSGFFRPPESSLIFLFVKVWIFDGISLPSQEG